MTKEQWLTYRSQQEISMDVFFEYYREVGGIIDNIFQFTNYFVDMMRKAPIMFYPNGKQKRVSYESAINKLYNYYDNKFGLPTD